MRPHAARSLRRDRAASFRTVRIDPETRSFLPRGHSFPVFVTLVRAPKSKHLDRISRDAGIDDLSSVLAGRIAPADLHSVLLDVYRQRSARRAVSDVLGDYRANRFLRPSAIDPREFLRWDAALFAALPDGAEAVELSPLAPLGSCSVVAGMSQDMSVVTARGLEVVSDATNMLALECAVRRRAALDGDRRSTTAVLLAAAHRLVRPQAPNLPGFNPHFRLFGMCGAGRDVDGERFHERSLREHVRVYLAGLRTYLGSLDGVRVVLTDLVAETPRAVWSTLCSAMSEELGSVAVVFDQQRQPGRTYSRDVCFHIHAGDVQLADGGGVDWGARLLGNARERMFISGIGSERVCAMRK